MATLASLAGEVRRLLDDLNERAKATASGDASTTFFPLPHQNIVGRSNVIPETALTDEAQTVTTNLVNPPHISVVYAKGNASGVAGNVVVTGTDFEGESTSDTIALSGSSAVAGTVLFKTITSIALPIETHAGTDTVVVYVASPLTCAVDGGSKVPGTDWICDYESGWFRFVSGAPDAGGEIIWNYIYSHYNKDDILSAINHAISDVWSEVPRTTTDTTTITAASTTYEYALPSTCLRLIRVDSRTSSTQPYEKLNNWRVVENGSTKYLYLFSAPTDGDTVRLHYIAEPGTMDEDSDTLAGVGLPERAKWAVVYGACFYLCENKLLPRARTNQFKNAEGVNVPKVYEIQRISADFRALTDIEMRKLRIGAKRWSV